MKSGGAPRPLQAAATISSPFVVAPVSCRVRQRPGAFEPVLVPRRAIMATSQPDALNLDFRIRISGFAP